MLSRPLDTSPSVSDRVEKTTCYMCACRCGINVHIKDGEIRYIEGNRDHPINKGVLCAKGSAGIMQHHSPARLSAPLLRTGPRGSGEYKTISWEEALTLASTWLKDIRARDPRKLAFFTGRDQSQALTGYWAQNYGTPNFAAHGGFCSVNMAAGGIMTLGGAFWEFGQPDWERCKLFLLFGVAEDHDSNPIKMGLAKLRKNGGRIVSINPVRTGYSAIADQWIGVRPGTDGLFILSLVHELLKRQSVDLDYLRRYSNASWLVIDAPDSADDGLIARGDDGQPLVYDSASKAVCAAGSEKNASFTEAVTLPDGRKARPVFSLLAETYLDEKYAAENVSEVTGIDAKTITDLADELADVAFNQAISLKQEWTDMRGETHSEFVGRPVAMHAMRGISAHSNGFQSARAIHFLQVLLGAVDCPGGFRFKPPYPKPLSAHPKPAGHPETIKPNTPLPGPPLGFPRGPEDLLLDENGGPVRIDKAYSWDAPISAHGMMHMVISNAHAGDPYPIDLLFMYMANMAWNSSMNTADVIAMLEDKDEARGEYRIPKIIYSDAYASETTAYADLILPDTTYLERHDCISLLDRPISEPEAVADSIRHPVVKPDREVRGFQSVLIDLGARIGLPGFVTETGEPKYQDYADYIVNHERKPGIGPLAGFRGKDGEASGRGSVNPEQINRYIENGGFWSHEIPEAAHFYKHANADYQKFAVEMGFFDAPHPVTFELYSEPLQKFRLAAKGFGERQPPEHLRERIKTCFDPLPCWYPPFEGENVSETEFPLNALTQRPMAMYHSWGSQNAWLRQIHTANPLYVPGEVCDKHDLKNGDWAWLSSHHGRIRVPIMRMEAVNCHTVWTWNAIGKRKGAWNLKDGAPEQREGFLLNHLIHELLPPKGDGLRWANSDPVTGQAAWYDLRVRIEKCEDQTSRDSLPQFSATARLDGQQAPPDQLRYGQNFVKGRRS